MGTTTVKSNRRGQAGQAGRVGPVRPRLAFFRGASQLLVMSHRFTVGLTFYPKGRRFTCWWSPRLKGLQLAIFSIGFVDNAK